MQSSWVLAVHFLTIVRLLPPTRDTGTCVIKENKSLGLGDKGVQIFRGQFCLKANQLVASAFPLCSKPKACHGFAHFILTQVCNVCAAIIPIMAQRGEMTCPKVTQCELGFERSRAGS